jgi:phage protein D
MADTPVTSGSVSIYTAPPTVKVDSQSNPTVNAQLIGMEMRESTGGLTSMELRFSNFGTFESGAASLVFEDDAVLKLGATIEVLGGDQTAQTPLFKGRISAIEGRYPAENPPELVVLAEDALQAARMKRRSKVHENVTLAGLVSSVAATCSLTPRTDGLDGNAGTHVQLNESDLAFVRRILARYDVDLQVVDDELHAAPLSQIQRNRIELTIDQKIRCARVMADLAHQVTAVEYSGWDFQQGQVITASSNRNLPGPGTGRGGSAILRQSFGERAEQLAELSVRNSAEAQALVDAEWEQRSRRFVTVHATAEGNPALRVGSHLEVKGLGARFSNTYYVVSTVHRYDQEYGYETDVVAECAYLGDGAS